MTLFCKVYLYPIFQKSSMKEKHLLELNTRLISVIPLQNNMNSTYQHYFARYISYFFKFKYERNSYNKHQSEKKFTMF
jgi:hypothetical protein